jgi:hypothetical protein
MAFTTKVTKSTKVKSKISRFFVSFVCFVVRSEFAWILATYHQFGGMKISSQLANNFDYCSAEQEYLLLKLLRAPRPLRLGGEYLSIEYSAKLNK